MTKLRRPSVLMSALAAAMAIPAYADASVPAQPTQATAPIGPFLIHALHTDKCLDVVGGPGATQDGAEVQQFTCIPGQLNQQWFFLRVDGTSSYQLIPGHAGFRCLDVVGGGGDGARVQQYTCLGPGQTNQHWYFSGKLELGSIGDLRPRHFLSRCLDVMGGSYADGARVQIFRCLGSSQLNQRWQLETVPRS